MSASRCDLAKWREGSVFFASEEATFNPLRTRILRHAFTDHHLQIGQIIRETKPVHYLILRKTSQSTSLSSVPAISCKVGYRALATPIGRSPSRLRALISPESSALPCTCRNAQLTWVKSNSRCLDLITVRTGVYKVVVMTLQIFANCFRNQMINRVV